MQDLLDNDDVLLLIFEMLGFRSRAKARRVSKHWNILLERVTSQPPLALFVGPERDDSNSQSACYPVSNCDHWRWESIRLTPVAAKRFLANYAKGEKLFLHVERFCNPFSLLEVVDECWFHLKTFVLVYTHDYFLVKKKQFLNMEVYPKVTNLSVDTDCNCLHGVGGQLVLADTFPNLRKLSIPDSTYLHRVDVLRLPQNLTTIWCPRLICYGDANTLPTSYLVAFEHLIDSSAESLRHFSCTFLDSKHLDYLLGQCPLLESLGATVLFSPNKPVLERLAHLSNLRHLVVRYPRFNNFRGVTSVTMRKLAGLLKLWPCLESLALVYVYYVSKPAAASFFLEQIGANAPRLKYFHFKLEIRYEGIYPHCVDGKKETDDDDDDDDRGENDNEIREIKIDVGALERLEYLETLRIRLNQTSIESLVFFIRRSNSLRNLHLDVSCKESEYDDDDDDDDDDTFIYTAFRALNEKALALPREVFRMQADIRRFPKLHILCASTCQPNLFFNDRWPTHPYMDEGYEETNYLFKNPNRKN